MSLTEQEQDELRAASARLSAQYEVTRALAESADVKEATPRILRAVCEALGWELGLVWVLDREEQSLRFVEAWSADAPEASEFVRASRGRVFVRGDGGLPARVWEQGRPLWVEDLASDQTFPRAFIAERAGLHAAVAFPVVMQGETVAVLEFFSRELRPPDEALLAMMSHVGSQIGQVIERQRAEAERARLREEVIRVQDELLAQLSTPLIPLNPRVMLMPLVGDMDEKRARRMLEALLKGLERSRAPVAIIDITGVSNVAARVADTLVAAARAARLLGTEVILTGIRPGVARTLVRLGTDLNGLNTRKTLQEGIDLAREYLKEQ